MLVYFHYLDKNSGWVTDYGGYDNFPEDYKTCGSPINRPSGAWRPHMKIRFEFPLL